MKKLPLVKVLEAIFSQDKNKKFIDKNNRLLVDKILEAIQKLDDDLIQLLLENKVTKKDFFKKVKSSWVFNHSVLFDFFAGNEYFTASSVAYKNKIGLIKKDNFIKKFDDVVLAWPYKEAILAGGQSREEVKHKKEIFYNEIIHQDEISRLLEPKVLTRFKKINQAGEFALSEIKKDKAGTIQDNLVIKGNNLLALHSLKNNFAGKVKLIYIDPPYNTGRNSFKYNDNFNHSTWLTFMKNRVEVAREMLRDDGAIFISINNFEHAYLKVLLDEVCGRENYVINFTWQTKKGATGIVTGNKVVDNYENILVYAKDKFLFSFKGIAREEKEFRNPDNDPRGPWKRQYLQRFGQGFTNKTIINPSNGMAFTFETPYAKEKLEKWIKEKVIIFPKAEKQYPARKEFLNNYKHNKQIVSSLGLFSTKSSTEELYKLFAGQKIFNNPKPEQLLHFIIDQASEPGDIVLDYHLGSGTTCAVAHKMRRQYIGIEQMNYLEAIAVKRLSKVIAGEELGISKNVNWQGGGEFVYCELKEIDNYQKEIIGKLNKNMKYLPLSELENQEYNIDKKEIHLNKIFYNL